MVEMLICRVRITTRMMSPPSVTLVNLRSVYHGTLGMVYRKEVRMRTLEQHWVRQ